jgi:hypothetical protein
MSEESSTKQEQTITVAGVTFTASQVLSAVVKIDGRKVHICEQDSESARIGFPT